MEKLTTKKLYDRLSGQFYLMGINLPGFGKTQMEAIRTILMKAKEEWYLEGMRSRPDVPAPQLVGDDTVYRQAVKDILVNSRKNNVSVISTIRALEELEKRLGVGAKFYEVQD